MPSTIRGTLTAAPAIIQPGIQANLALNLTDPWPPPNDLPWPPTSVPPTTVECWGPTFARMSALANASTVELEIYTPWRESHKDEVAGNPYRTRWYCRSILATAGP